MRKLNRIKVIVKNPPKRTIKVKTRKAAEMKRKFEKAVHGDPKLAYKDGELITLDTLLEEINNLSMAIELSASENGLLFEHIEDAEGNFVLHIVLNDIFGPGADLEPITPSEISNVYDLYQTLGGAGVINYVAGLRETRAR